ncbi:hypothetical protein ACWNXI_12045 [Caldibacillus thermoamylovorans]
MSHSFGRLNATNGEQTLLDFDSANRRIYLMAQRNERSIGG